MWSKTKNKHLLKQRAAAAAFLFLAKAFRCLYGKVLTLQKRKSPPRYDRQDFYTMFFF